MRVAFATTGATVYPTYEQVPPILALIFHLLRNDTLKRLLAFPIFISALLLTTGCTTASTDNAKTTERPDESLINTYWKLVALDDKQIITQENSREAHFVLHQEASRLAGATGCNSLMGSYLVKDERIEFNQMGTTRMACPQPQMETEQGFLAALEQAAQWRVDGDTLVLSDDQDEPLAHFQAVHLY
ncbi:META domain-containing protein [Halomonas casei]